MPALTLLHVQIHLSNWYLSIFHLVAFLLGQSISKGRIIPLPIDVPPSQLSFFLLFRATLPAYVSSQARGQIGATAADLHRSSSNPGSLTHWARPGFKPTSSWILVGFISTEPQKELPPPPKFLPPPYKSHLTALIREKLFRKLSVPTFISSTLTNLSTIHFKLASSPHHTTGIVNSLPEPMINSHFPWPLSILLARFTSQGLLRFHNTLCLSTIIISLLASFVVYSSIRPLTAESPRVLSLASSWCQPYSVSVGLYLYI